MIMFYGSLILNDGMDEFEIRRHPAYVDIDVKYTARPPLR
jgi:hypothetical protein